MVNFRGIFVSIVLSFALSTLATPVARETFITHPLVKQTGGSIADILAQDQARLAGYNSQAFKSATVTNTAQSYLAAVKVGFQTFNLVVDTGSSNTWVGAGSTKFHSGFTGFPTGHSVSVKYGSGAFTGTEWTDIVSLGSATVFHQSIGVASSSTGFSHVDGIIGLGPIDLTENKVSGVATVPTFTNNLLSQRTISSEVLGVSFRPEAGSDNDDANGELTFGGTDSSKYTGSITYAPKSTTAPFNRYWGVDVPAISYDGQSIGSASCIVDTGSTLIYIPTPVYDSFLSASGGTADAATGFAKFDTPPTGTFSFTIGGTVLALTPAQYLVPPAQYAHFRIPADSGYYAWINGGGPAGGTLNCIIGQKFLENYYSVYDTTNSRIGFALAA